MTTFIIVWLILSVVTIVGIAAYEGWQMYKDSFAMSRYIEVIRRHDHELLVVDYAAWLLLCGNVVGAKRVIEIVRALRNAGAADTASDVQLHFAIGGFSPVNGYTAVDYVMSGAIKEEQDVTLVRTLLKMKYRQEAAPVFSEVVRAGAKFARRALSVHDEVEAAVLGSVMYRTSTTSTAA